MFYLLQTNFDVFNALDLSENKQFLEKLKFGIGDGNLQYYLYNWKCPDMKPQQVSIGNNIEKPAYYQKAVHMVSILLALY